MTENIRNILNLIFDKIYKVFDKYTYLDFYSFIENNGLKIIIILLIIYILQNVIKKIILYASIMILIISINNNHNIIGKIKNIFRDNDAKIKSKP